MPSIRFEPFHVYEVNKNYRNAETLPFTFFLCITTPLPYATSRRHAIIGMPIIEAAPPRGAQDLHIPLDTSGSNQVRIAGQHAVFLDMLGSYPYDLFLPIHRGRVQEKERAVIKDKLRRLLDIC